MNERIKEDINLLPEKPGCYQMYDINDEIIYIGKAKNLKKRVSQYFLRSQSGKTFAMVSHVEYFKIIITKTEKEAFILEMNLIQKHLPRYNILLKDDKHYPYIALHKTSNPYISIARSLKDKKCEYFGPFPLSTNAYEMVNLLNKLFPLRKCNKIPSSPCLYYHLNQCLAPCINKVSKESYEVILNKIEKFLKGDNISTRMFLYDICLNSSFILITVVVLSFIWDLLGGEPIENLLNMLWKSVILLKNSKETGLSDIYTNSGVVFNKSATDFWKSGKKNIDIMTYSMTLPLLVPECF